MNIQSDDNNNDIDLWDVMYQQISNKYQISDTHESSESDKFDHIDNLNIYVYCVVVVIILLSLFV